MKRFTVLLLGGYGAFGGRIARLLADEPGLQLIIAGRSERRAAAFSAGLPTASAARPARIDRDGDLPATLSELRPDLVIDASGPFQSYGPDPYHVARACMAANVHYLNLADGGAFVAGFSALEAAARAQGVVALTGVSSFPMLTAEVVQHLSADLGAVHTVRGGVAPSPRAVVGPNVLRAIAGYAGNPTLLCRAGTTTTAYPLTEGWRATVARPGRLPLRRRWFALVDVPDLVVLGRLWPELQDGWIGAGTAPQPLLRLLWAMAWLVRLRLVPSLGPLAGHLHRVGVPCRFGPHRGGLVVAVTGTAAADGRPVARSWHLVARAMTGRSSRQWPHSAWSAACAAATGRSPAPGRVPWNWIWPRSRRSSPATR